MTVVAERAEISAQASPLSHSYLYFRQVAIRVGSIIALFILWQVVSFFVTETFVPGPAATISALYANTVSGLVAEHFLVTIQRMLLSFSLAMLVGIVLGVVMGLSRICEQILDLWIMVGLTIPGLVYILVAFMWLGMNERASVLAIAWTTFPSMTINIWQGVKALDQRLVDMARVFGANRWRRTTRVIIPQTLPYLMAAVRFGLGIIWKVTVLVELLGRSDGVGYMLNLSFQLFDMTDVFAWTFFFTIVMIVIEGAILKPMERRLFRWRPEVRG